MTDQLHDLQLLNYNSLGLIPGPSESLIEFATRASYCLTLKDQLSKDIHTLLNCETTSPPPLSPEDGFLKAQHLYDISPDWIPIFFSNYQLTPWHGGCAWIFQHTDNSPTATFLQLRKSLEHKNRYLGVYSKEELVAHELAHIGRMMFEEPRFEEILAYATSPSKFRRWLGPILESSKESVFFVVILAMILLIDAFLIVFSLHQIYLSAMWLKLIPIGMIIWSLLRLKRKHETFNHCLENLSNCLHSKAKAYHVIYRLQDSEISLFSSICPPEIRKYAAKRAKDSLRWRIISLAYFSKY